MVANGQILALGIGGGLSLIRRAVATTRSRRIRDNPPYHPWGWSATIRFA